MRRPAGDSARSDSATALKALAFGPGGSDSTSAREPSGSRCSHVTVSSAAAQIGRRGHAVRQSAVPAHGLAGRVCVQVPQPHHLPDRAPVPIEQSPPNQRPHSIVVAGPRPASSSSARRTTARDGSPAVDVLRSQTPDRARARKLLTVSSERRRRDDVARVRRRSATTAREFERPAASRRRATLRSVFGAPLEDGPLGPRCPSGPRRSGRQCRTPVIA